MVMSRMNDFAAKLPRNVAFSLQGWYSSMINLGLQIGPVPI